MLWRWSPQPDVHGCINHVELTIAIKRTESYAVKAGVRHRIAMWIPPSFSLMAD